MSIRALLLLALGTVLVGCGSGSDAAATNAGNAPAGATPPGSAPSTAAATN